MQPSKPFLAHATGFPVPKPADSTAAPPVPGPAPLQRVSIAGLPVCGGDYASVTAQVLAWAQRGEARTVCVATVHTVMEARDRSGFRSVFDRIDHVVAEGMPLVWVLQRRLQRPAQRIQGPELVSSVCAAAEAAGLPVAFFGGTPAVLQRMAHVLRWRHPRLRIVAEIAPPAGGIAPELDTAQTEALVRSGARIVFVGLGCPNQERWMAAHRGRIPAVLLGVGAAFDFHAGVVRPTPGWLQKLGLEWAFRLALEPRRLWKRYAWHNPRFIWAILREEGKRRSAERLKLRV